MCLCLLSVHTGYRARGLGVGAVTHRVRLRWDTILNVHSNVRPATLGARPTHLEPLPPQTFKPIGQTSILDLNNYLKHI